MIVTSGMQRRTVEKHRPGFTQISSPFSCWHETTNRIAYSSCVLYGPSRGTWPPAKNVVMDRLVTAGCACNTRA